MKEDEIGRACSTHGREGGHGQTCCCRWTFTSFISRKKKRVMMRLCLLNVITVFILFVWIPETPVFITINVLQFDLNCVLSSSTKFRLLFCVEIFCFEYLHLAYYDVTVGAIKYMAARLMSLLVQCQYCRLLFGRYLIYS